MNFPANPYARAHAAYHAEPPGLPWNDMISAHFHTRDAWLLSTPRLFIAARIVRHNWPGRYLLDPLKTASSGDMVHVYIAAGKLRDLIHQIPPAILWQIQWFSFQRRGYRMHVIEASRLIRRDVTISSYPLRPT